MFVLCPLLRREDFILVFKTLWVIRKSHLFHHIWIPALPEEFWYNLTQVMRWYAEMENFIDAINISLSSLILRVLILNSNTFRLLMIKKSFLFKRNYHTYYFLLYFMRNMYFVWISLFIESLWVMKCFYTPTI